MESGMSATYKHLREHLKTPDSMAWSYSPTQQPLAFRFAVFSFILLFHYIDLSSKMFSLIRSLLSGLPTHCLFSSHHPYYVLHYSGTTLINNPVPFSVEYQPMFFQQPSYQFWKTYESNEYNSFPNSMLCS